PESREDLNSARKQGGKILGHASVSEKRDLVSALSDFISREPHLWADEHGVYYWHYYRPNRRDCSGCDRNGAAGRNAAEAYGGHKRHGTISVATTSPWPIQAYCRRSRLQANHSARCRGPRRRPHSAGFCSSIRRRE